ncbi:MAG: SGNH/GDSL hydrolase family protein [Candidatus Eisenbacteria bacterium]|nr:SGNH/GDSL hydrolase family protein [Candidatus Eisenbacteria bacterium]
MRDKEYAAEKPAETVRLAILGTSYVVGLGVPVDGTFEALAEERMNREKTPETGVRYEILNMGVGGYRMVHRLQAMEEKAFRLDPDAILFTVHETDPANLRDLSDAARKKVTIHYPDLAEMVRQAGVDESTPEAVAERRLKPIGYEITSWTYREVVRKCRGRGIAPFWLFLPTTEEHFPADVYRKLRGFAEEAGFEILDLAGVYEGRDVRSLRLGDWDHHLNAEGHRLVADRLYEALVENGTVFAGGGATSGALPGAREPEE